MTQPTAQLLQSELRESRRLEIEGHKLQSGAERRAEGTQANIGQLSAALRVDGGEVSVRLVREADKGSQHIIILTIGEALGLAGWLRKHVGTRTAQAGEKA